MIAKYRGRRIDNNEWVYGLLNIGTQGEQHKRYIAYAGLYSNVEVDPATVGMWTGKANTEGVEVYEDDKLADDEYDYMVVEWDTDRARFTVNGYGNAMHHNEGGGEEYSQEITLLDTDVVDMENIDQYTVIGNVHDK